MANPGVLFSEPGIKRVAWFHFVGNEPENASWRMLRDWVLANGIEYGKRRFVGFDNPHPTVADPHGYEAQMVLQGDEGADGSFLGANVREYDTGGSYISVTVPINDMDMGWSAIIDFCKTGGFAIDTEHRQYFEEHLFPEGWWNPSETADPTGHEKARIDAATGFRIWIPVVGA